MTALDATAADALLAPARTLAFRRTTPGCGLCGGAGVLPDADRPTALKPCPRCRPGKAPPPPPEEPEPPRRRKRERIRWRLPALSDLVWNAFMAMVYGAVGVLTLVMVAGLATIFV